MVPMRERNQTLKRPRAQSRSRAAPPHTEQEKGPRLLIDCKYANELPKPQVPKLLRALPSVDRLCRYKPSSLELDSKPFLLSERDLLSRLEIVDPNAYGEAPAKGSMLPPPPPEDAQLFRDDDVSDAVKEAEAKRRRLTERTEADHRQAFGLQLPQLITNDVFTERQRFITGTEAAEKKLLRNPPGFGSVEELASKIERTFEAAKKPPVHPSKPSMKAKRVLDIVPDAVLWANRYRQVMFDELASPPTRDDLLFRSTPTPRATCFGYFSRDSSGDAGAYKLAENYFWDNRGGFTKAQGCGEGEGVLLSFPNGEDAAGEVRFVMVPTFMKLKKQKAHRIEADIGLETQALQVSHRDPSAQEAAEEQDRMNMVLTDEVRRDRSEASLDFVDGEWQIRGDPRTESGRSRQERSGEPSSTASALRH